MRVFKGVDKAPDMDPFGFYSRVWRSKVFQHLTLVMNQRIALNKGGLVPVVLLTSSTLPDNLLTIAPLPGHISMP